MPRSAVCVASLLSAAEHGTYAGYQAHKRRHEPACDECLEAAAEYAKAYREKNPEYRRTNVLLNAARAAAHRRVAEEHYPEFLRYFDEEREKRGV